MLFLWITTIKKYRSVILVSIFFFYLGCGITTSLLRIECADAASENEADFNGLGHIEYAVLILSAPGNDERRDAIRETWMNLADNIFVENEEILYKWNPSKREKMLRPAFVKFYFVVGTGGLNKQRMLELIAERERSKDMLFIENFNDMYKNLTAKIIQALKVLKNNLHGLKYLIKCDDDSFVRVDLIIKYLEAFAPEMSDIEISEYVSSKKKLPHYKGLYWGYFQGKARVYLSGKWPENDWFMCDNYLPYALGGGYVISRSIIDYIVKNADFLSLYNSEDVSMGVWTAALDGINRVHDVRFDTEWKSRGCNNQMLIRHKQSPSDMLQMYRNLRLTHGDKICNSETTDRKAYMYEWNRPPSFCCS